MKTKKQTKTKPDRAKPGPKRMGVEKRIHTTISVDPTILQKAKRHAASIDRSLSLWIEELMRPHLRKPKTKR
jgi:hypothetical protein